MAGIPKFGDSTVDSYYSQMLETLPSQEIGYTDISTERRSREEIAKSIADYLEPYLDKSVSSVKANERSQRAALDADAASRGMTSSTYLSDTKRQVSRAAQADIADLRSAFVSNVAQQTEENWGAQVNRLLTVDTTNAANRLTRDQWNASARAALEALAYQRALETKARIDAGKSSGTPSDTSGDGITKYGVTPDSWEDPNYWWERTSGSGSITGQGAMTN